jgi:hypothetical protein
MGRKSTYSFGEESPIKFQLSDKMAQLYNEAAAEFFKAQQRFNQKVGRRWDPAKDPIKIRWNRKQRQAWNDFTKVFNEVVTREGPFHPNDIMDDFLVKNTSVAVSTASNVHAWGIPMLAAAGVLYGLLNRRQGVRSG